MPPARPVLTLEQRMEILAFRRAEQKRLAEELRIQQKHDHLSREVAFGRLTVKRHERNWKKMLTEVSLPRMRKDLEFAWHMFERVIDFKDFAISLLMDEIRDAEEQYMLNFKNHAENIDKLITRFRDRLDELKADCDSEIDLLRLSAEKEAEEIRASAESSEDYLKTMLYGLEVARKEQEKLVRGDYLSKIDEDCSKYSDIIQNLKAGLERVLSKIWDNTKIFLNNYNTQTAERRKAYIALEQQDTAIQKLCNNQRIKLSKMHDNIKNLKTYHVELQEIEGRNIEDLVEERQYFADAFWTLRTRLASDRALDAANLQLLSVQSNEVTSYLENIAKRGEKLLELAAVCRKLETKEEKILPFPFTSSNEGVSTIQSDIDIRDFANSAELYLFWQRVAQADAIRYSINEEREFLKRENRMLKKRIHEYCQCLDCPIYDTKKDIQVKSGGKINVIDGNVIKQCYDKQCQNDF